MMKWLVAIVAGCVLSTGAWAAVDLNTATEQELQAVRGIGPGKAKAIVEYRKKHGPFASIDDLSNVKGFGPRSLAKLRSELTVSTPEKKEESKPAAARPDSPKK